jgi:RimJ/RimL family protein N-acetyltransferase
MNWFSVKTSASNGSDNMLPAMHRYDYLYHEILETERLILREINEDDFDDLYRMNSDPLIIPTLSS